MADDRYLALFERNPQPLFVWEKLTGRILAVNRAACEAYGFSERELQSMTVFALRKDEPEAQRMPLPEPGSVVERTHRRRDGTLRDSEMHTSEVMWEGRPAMMTLLVDVTQRNAESRRVRRIGRLYATSIQINRTIFGLPDRASILQAACDIAVKAGNFRLAWIGLLNEETKYLDVVAYAGLAVDYVRNIRVTVRDVPEGRGPMGIAMRERRVVVDNDFLNSATGKPWREDAARNELRAIICAPIFEDGSIIGALALYGSEVGMFQEDEQRLVTELTSDIGLALYDLDRRTRLALEQRVRAITTEIYELIATDAPLERVSERLRTMLAVYDVGRSAEWETVTLPLVGTVEIAAAQRHLLRSVEQLARIAIERAEARASLEHQALHDSLTDLPNRLVFADRLTQALAAAKRFDRRIAVGLLDLDRFKLVNDTLGHAQGDALLRAVALRLQSALRTDETIARMGGDEFLLIFNGLHHPSEAGDAARRLLERLEEPFTVNERELYVSGSLGLVVSKPDVDVDAGVLLQQADQAMYQAKRTGSGYAIFIDGSTDDLDASDLELENDLHRALQRDEFVLHFQPFVDAQNGEVPAVEALVRWQHPTYGMIYPERFIPLAEANGLILPIGDWVLRAACMHAAQWARDGHHVAVTVNVSARQFAQPGFQATVVQAFALSGLSAAQLWIEVTETSMMQSMAATAHVMADLKSIGVRILIDDFGTGYSSLSYLHRLPIDMLKIDRSFVSDIDPEAAPNSNGIEIARAIVGLANGLGVSVVAEGVETESQRRVLETFGCRLMQGFRFYRPVAATEISRILDAVKASAKRTRGPDG